MNRKSKLLNSSIMTGLIAAAVLGLPCTGIAQPAATTPFTSSSELSALALSADRSEALSYLAQPRVNPQRLFPLRRSLCASMTKQTLLSDDAPRMALSTVKSGLATELQFESTDKVNNPSSFALYVQFNGDSVLLRRSNPRFASEERGLAVSYPKDVARPLWFEGLGDSSVFAFIPPIPECAVEAVVLCPRKRAPTAELVPTSYTIVAQKLTGSAIADGIYGPPSGTTGRLQASMLGSPGVSLPNPWFVTHTSSGLPITTALATDPKTNNSPAHTPAQLPIPSLPTVSAIEARLEIGSETDVRRTISSRSSVQISEHPMPQQATSVIGPTTYRVAPGRCYLVSGWTEKNL